MTAFETRLFIDGAFAAGEGPSEKAYEPALGIVLAEVASASPTQVDAAVEAAARAFKSWSQTTPKERSLALLAIADAIEKAANELGLIESRNAGKPLRYARTGEIGNVVDVFRFFATAVRNVPAPAAGNYRSSTRTSIVRRDPIGVVAQIAPWN